jgi:hypothetical protein
MGTSTFFLRNNDLGRPLHRMNKKELEKLNNLSPYDKDTHCLGWNVPLELHNGNVYILVFWKGGLMKLEDAPNILNKKHYDKYPCKTTNYTNGHCSKNLP